MSLEAEREKALDIWTENTSSAPGENEQCDAFRAGWDLEDEPDRWAPIMISIAWKDGRLARRRFDRERSRA